MAEAALPALWSQKERKEKKRESKEKGQHTDKEPSGGDTEDM